MAKRPKVKPTAASARPALPPPRPSAAWPLVQSAGRAGLALCIVFGVMFAIVWVAGQTGRVVAPQARYAQDFDLIDCQPPPGMDKKLFLTQVRYGPDLPDRLQVVDPQLKTKLAAAFAGHPWVESVESIEVRPNRRVEVGLKFRVAKLAVAVQGRPGKVVVDREAVILPEDASPAGLAEFATPQPPPAEKPGQKWDNKAVKFAADAATKYDLTTIELVKGYWETTRKDGTHSRWWAGN